MKNFLAQNRNMIKNIVILGLAYLTGLSLAIVYDYGITGIEVIVPCLMTLAAVVYYKAASVCKIGMDKADDSTVLQKSEQA